MTEHDSTDDETTELKVTDGGNLPPGVSISDSDAPWNGPHVEDLFPLICDECGYRASDRADMEDHEHSREEFRRPNSPGEAGVDPEPPEEPAAEKADRREDEIAARRAGKWGYGDDEEDA